ncbi:MAG: DUF6799 domain-containing protein [Ferruginibacter sp.]
MKKIIMVMIIFVAGKNINAESTSYPKISLLDTLPARDTTMKDYVSVQGGQVILVQNNKAGRMTKDLTMKNGTVVKTDGSVKTNDGHTFQLKEGDRIYMNGRIEGPEKSPIN